MPKSVWSQHTRTSGDIVFSGIFVHAVYIKSVSCKGLSWLYSQKGCLAISSAYDKARPNCHLSSILGTADRTASEATCKQGK